MTNKLPEGWERDGDGYRRRDGAIAYAFDGSTWRADLQRDPRKGPGGNAGMPPYVLEDSDLAAMLTLNEKYPLEVVKDEEN